MAIDQPTDATSAATDANPPQPLEPDRASLLSWGSKALAYLADFTDGLPDAPARGLAPDGELLDRLRQSPPHGPGDFGALLALFAEAVAKSRETAGPGNLAHVPGGGVITAALAELLAYGTNRHTGVSFAAAPLVAMEDGVLRWLCELFGFPATAVGVTTTGGSLAGLSAVVAARERHLGTGIATGTAYVTAHTHFSVRRAARIAGLAPEHVRVVPVTAELRIDPVAAARMIADDRAAGLTPFLLVGTAGSTDTGTVDPLPALGDLARREGLWFHVDAAYGGFFQLTGRGRAALSGIERAD